MNYSKCFACNQELKYFCQKDGQKILRCPICGLGVTQNLVSQKENYHRDESYIKQKSQFTNIFTRRVRLINDFKLNPGVVLEVGSSTGALLKILKQKGWEVYGVEPSKQASKFANEDGITTVTSKFENAKLAVETVDVIVINHTLEHLPDLEDVLDKSFKTLKDDGILVIDVPNFGGISAYLQRCQWPYLLPNEHHWHFTKEALSKLLNKFGFEVVFNKSYSGIWDYGNPYLEVWQSFIGFKKRFFENLLMLLPALITTQFNVGNDLTIVAKKQEAAK